MPTRADIPESRHSVIDSSLKTLKTFIKYVYPLNTSFESEARLLERLYYKSKNQHRSALFLRKVGEVRRMAARITQKGSKNLLERLRDSFYAPNVRDSNKRPAWTEVPNNKHLVSVMHQLRDVARLQIKSRTILASAYRSFELLIQSSTFLPLALTLVAIVSRMDLILFEVLSLLHEVWPAVQSLIPALNYVYTGPSELLPLPNTHTTNGSDISTTIPAVLNVNQPISQAYHLTASSAPPPTSLCTKSGDEEDLGQSISRDGLLQHIVHARGAQHSPNDNIKNRSAAEEGDFMTVDAPLVVLTNPELAIQDVEMPLALPQVPEPLGSLASALRSPSPTTHTIPLPQAAPSFTQNKRVLTGKRKSATESINNSGQGLTKRKKKKKDEIDDIFGGL